MNYDRNDCAKAARPAPPSDLIDQCNKNPAPTGRKPELMECIERQRGLQETLWERLTQLETALRPILRGGPAETEGATAKEEANTQITSILFDQCRSTSAMIEKVESISMRLEV